MIEAGEVGAVFTVVDRASAVLKAIADQLKVLQERIDAIQARFDGLGADSAPASIRLRWRFQAAWERPQTTQSPN